MKKRIVACTLGVSFVVSSNGCHLCQCLGKKNQPLPPYPTANTGTYAPAPFTGYAPAPTQQPYAPYAPAPGGYNPNPGCKDCQR